jgi:hypothetical protein
MTAGVIPVALSAIGVPAGAWRLGHLKSILGFAWEYIHSPRSQPMQTPEGWKWNFNS